MQIIRHLKQTPVLPRGRGVTAAQRAFNPHGEGSNPSDLMRSSQPSAISSQPEKTLWLTTDR